MKNKVILTDQQLSEIKTKAVVCFLLNKNQVLLGLRKKSTTNLGVNLISGIGGKLEPGETYQQALIRECEEETTVKIKDFQEMGTVYFYLPYKPIWSQKVKVYLATSWQGEPNETDSIKPVWYDKDKLPWQQMWEDNNYWLPKVLAGKKIEAYFHFGENEKILQQQIIEL